jgi:hypothetical protein
MANDFLPRGRLAAQIHACVGHPDTSRIAVSEKWVAPEVVENGSGLAVVAFFSHVRRQTGASPAGNVKCGTSSG